MDKDKWGQTQLAIWTVAGVICQMPLEEFIEANSKALSVGPIVDPTLFQKKRGDLLEVNRVAVALNKAKQLILENPDLAKLVRMVQDEKSEEADKTQGDV